MKNYHRGPLDIANTAISRLAGRLDEAEQRLQALAGGEVDAVILQSGQPYLLRAAQEKLRQSEERFRNMFTAAAAGMGISTPDGRFLQVNAAYCGMLGYSESELVGVNFARLTHPDDLALNLNLRDEMLAGRRDSFVMEKRYLRKNGDVQWARVSISAARTALGEIATLLVVAEDIGERKLAELRLNRLHRLHTVLRKICEAIVRTGDRQHLYDTACRIVVEDGLLRMVFIAELDNASGLASPLAWYGEGLGYLLEPTSVFPTDGGPLSQGTTGTCLRTGVYDVCNDIASTARMKPWHEAAKRNGLRATASFPLIVRGATIGVLVLYAGEIDYFLDDEISLMMSVASNLSYAIESLDKEVQRQRAEMVSTQLSAIVESSDDAIIGKDLNGIVTSWNKGAEKIFGYSAEEMAGTSITRVIPADHPDEEAEILARIRAGESVKNLETVRQAKGGRFINVSITASPIKNTAGDIIGVSKVARDITHAKKFDARFRRLLDSNAQGVFFFRLSGAIVGGNDAFLNLTRYTREDMNSGKLNWDVMTPPEYAGRNQHAVEELRATGVCTTFEKEFIRKDGSRLPILLGAAMFEDDPEEGVCFVVDLTERKKLEEQFRHAQKMEGIGNLAGGVAHDFNNILAVIQVQADFLKSEGGLSADQTESTDDILAAVERAGALTRQLLLFSSQQSFKPRDLDLSTSIANTIKMLKRLVGEHIEIRFKMAPEPMFLHADSSMIDQIMLNLVLNACDAMPDGGQLVIETYGVEFDDLAASLSAPMRAGSFVCLSIGDTGCGIPPEILPAIFEPFFTTKDVGKGTGLGLATVFGIVHQHQGWINVYSEVGHGTTFRIYLPRLARNAQPKLPPSSFKAMHGGSEPILLVEDDPKLRASIKTALSRLGYQVIEAPNAVEALDIWRENRRQIRLLLTDLVMPGGKSGRDLTHNIRQENPGLKVIYMSGYSAELAGKNYQIQEDVTFLTKPFRAHELAKAVRNCLDEV